MHGGQHIGAEVVRFDVLETRLPCRGKQALGTFRHFGIGMQRAGGNEDLRSVRELIRGLDDLHKPFPSCSNCSPSIS